MHKHVAVWIDHKEARIFDIEDSDAGVVVTAPPRNIHHRHARGETAGKEHPNDAKRFYADVGRLIEGTEKVLVVGPSTAKLEFLRYLHEHDRALERNIVGIETVDHPTDGQLVAYAKKYFHLRDRIQ